MAIIINNTTKREELSQLQALQLEIDNLLQDPNIDESIKAQVRQDIALTQDTIHADKMSNRDARHYVLGVYNGIKKKLTGEPGYSESLVGGATKNMFGQYSPAETAWMSNETLRRSAQAYGVGSTTKPIQYDPVSGPASTIHSFNPAEVSQVYRIAGSTPNQAQAIRDFAQYLTTALTGARNVLLNGNASLQDWKQEHTVEMVNEWLNKLRSVGSGSKEQLDQQILDMGQIVTQLQNSNIQNTFESYFTPWLEGFSETTGKTGTGAGTGTGGRTFTVNGATQQHTPYPDTIIEDLIVKNGWYVKKGEDGNYYAYDKNNGIKALASIIGVNPYADSYQRGVFTDNTGRIYAGSLTPDPSGVNDDFVRQLAAAGIDWETAVRNAHTSHYGPIVNGAAQGLGRYVDMSRFYRGSEGLRYQLPDDEKDDPLWWDLFPLGKDNFVFEGNADVTAAGSATGDQYLQQVGDATQYITDVEDFDESYAQSHFGGSGDDSGDINLKGLSRDPLFSESLNHQPGKLGEAITAFAYYQLLWTHLDNLQKQEGLSQEEIQELEDGKIEVFAALQELCPDYKREVTAKGGTTGQFGNIMWQQILNSPHIRPILKSIVSNPQMQSIRSTVLQMLEHSTPTKNKQGGILKAQPGNSLDYLNTDKTSPVVRAARKEYYGDNVPYHALSEDEQLGIRLLMFSSLVDLSDIALGGSGHKFGRFFGPAAAVTSAALDGAAAGKLGMDQKTKNWLMTADAVNAGLSIVPFIQKIPKIKRLEYARAAARVTKGLQWLGVGLGAALTGMNAGPATEGITKLLNGQAHLMTEDDWSAIIGFTTGLAGTIKGISGVKYQNKSRPITKSDSKVWVDAVVDGKRQAVQVDKSKVDGIDTKVLETAATRKTKAQEALKNDLPEGATLYHPWWKRGTVNTKPVLEITPENMSDMARRQSQTRIFRQSIATPFGPAGGSTARFTMTSDPYFGPWRGINLAPIEVNAKFFNKDGKFIQVLEVPADDFKRAQSQFTSGKGADINGTKMSELGVTGYADDAAAYLAKSKDGKSDIIIVAKPKKTTTPTSTTPETPPSNRKGGRLERLNLYINK